MPPMRLWLSSGYLHDLALLLMGRAAARPALGGSLRLVLARADACACIPRNR